MDSCPASTTLPIDRAVSLPVPRDKLAIHRPHSSDPGQSAPLAIPALPIQSWASRSKETATEPEPACREKIRHKSYISTEPVWDLSIVRLRAACPGRARSPLNQTR